jgi:hypothetical protein
MLLFTIRKHFYSYAIIISRNKLNLKKNNVQMYPLFGVLNLHFIYAWLCFLSSCVHCIESENKRIYGRAIAGG